MNLKKAHSVWALNVLTGFPVHSFRRENPLSDAFQAAQKNVRAETKRQKAEALRIAKVAGEESKKLAKEAQKESKKLAAEASKASMLAAKEAQAACCLRERTRSPAHLP